MKSTLSYVVIAGITLVTCLASCQKENEILPIAEKKKGRKPLQVEQLEWNSGHVRVPLEVEPLQWNSGHIRIPLEVEPIPFNMEQLGQLDSADVQITSVDSDPDFVGPDKEK